MQTHFRLEHDPAPQPSSAAAFLARFGLAAAGFGAGAVLGAAAADVVEVEGALASAADGDSARVAGATSGVVEDASAAFAKVAGPFESSVFAPHAAAEQLESPACAVVGRATSVARGTSFALFVAAGAPAP
ncbi:MAG TPA: hypothetical protein VH142_00005, partial [Polyangiaceae bacterium]|nr:hypothetical protein [Polyangiaceae bacterium]